MRKVFIVEIHHVARLVIFVVDVLLKILWQAKMLGRVFRFEEGSSQVVNPILHLDLEFRVGEHRGGEIEHNVGRTRKKKAKSPA